MLPQKIAVALGERSYVISYHKTLAELSKITFHNAFVITDTRVAQKQRQALADAFRDLPVLTIPAGEKSKSLAAIEKMANNLVRLGANRQSTLIAFGGGVVGDFTGFLAGIFMRGIDFVQIPTTLLAMVDSSVGGKTAVNLPVGKNMVGVFHQPKAVYIVPEVLRTLPLRELQCGIAESIKTALIGDAALFYELERYPWQKGHFDPEFYAMLSARAIAVKARIVAEDEKEQSIRAWLNFGHTLGHALEAYAGYRGILHGEAVALGMRFASLLSRRLGLLSKETEERIAALLAQYHLPRTLAHFRQLAKKKTLDLKKIIGLMQADKKSDARGIRFVLLEDIGRARLPQHVAPQELLAALKEFQSVVC